MVAEGWVGRVQDDAPARAGWRFNRGGSQENWVLLADPATGRRHENARASLSRGHPASRRLSTSLVEIRLFPMRLLLRYGRICSYFRSHSLRCIRSMRYPMRIRGCLRAALAGSVDMRARI